MEYSYCSILYNLSLSSNKVIRQAKSYKLLKYKQKEIFYLAKKYYRVKEKIEEDIIAMEQELKSLNNSIKQLELYIEKAINWELTIYNKLNQNAVLADFNLSLLDFNLSVVSLSSNPGIGNGTEISSQSN